MCRLRLTGRPSAWLVASTKGRPVCSLRRRTVVLLATYRRSTRFVGLDSVAARRRTIAVLTMQYLRLRHVGMRGCLYVFTACCNQVRSLECQTRRPSYSKKERSVKLSELLSTLKGSRVIDAYLSIDRAKLFVGTPCCRPNRLQSGNFCSVARTNWKQSSQPLYIAHNNVGVRLARSVFLPKLALMLPIVKRQ